MTDCGNTEIRELLPDMLHNALSVQDRHRVEAHLQTCADCREELDLLSGVYSLGNRTVVDVERIAASIKPYRRRTFVSPTLVRLAAAIGLVAVGSLSYSIVNKSVGDGTPGRESAIAVLPTDSAVPLVPVAGDAASTSDVNSFDAQAIEELMARLDKLDASIKEEPRPIVKSIGTDGN